MSGSEPALPCLPTGFRGLWRGEHRGGLAVAWHAGGLARGELVGVGRRDERLECFDGAAGCVYGAGGDVSAAMPTPGRDRLAAHAGASRGRARSTRGWSECRRRRPCAGSSEQAAVSHKCVHAWHRSVHRDSRLPEVVGSVNRVPRVPRDRHRLARHSRNLLLRPAPPALPARRPRQLTRMLVTCTRRRS